ncbi:MAG: CbiQ family ECF transporter T component, partial [Clostridia bacterium]|nr:CbiQ family ECF transporter T component [Clostridia bacterium]
MVRDVSFGQYFPGKSLIHRLDPRAKILMFIAYLVIIFCTFNYFSLAITTLFTVFYILASRISPKFYFKSLKVIIFIVIITSLLNLFYGSGDPLFEWWIFRITYNG